MRLGVQVLISVAVVSGAAASGVLWLTRSQVLDGFAALEEQQAIEVGRRAQALFATQLRDFRVMSQDWAEWGDMVTYVGSADPAWRDDNLIADSFLVKQWEQLALVRADGVRVFEARLDGEALAPVTPGFDALIRSGDVVFPPDEERPVEAFVAMDGAVWAVASQPIRNTDRSIGAHRGAMVYARRVDDAWVARAEEISGLDLAFTGSEDAELAIEGRSPDAIRTGAPVLDLRGRPVGRIAVVTPRPALQAGNQVRGSLAGGLAAAGVGLAVAALLLTRVGLLRPVGAVLAAVRRLERGERVDIGPLGNAEFDELAQAFDGMATTLLAREQALVRAADEVARVLDNTGDGLAQCDLHGRIVGRTSAAAERWFGSPTGDAASWLFADDATAALTFALGLEDLRDDVLPTELTLDQLPRRVVREGATLDLSYRSATLADGQPGLLLLIRDVTAELGRQRAEAEAKELQSVVARLLRDQGDFRRFVAESEALLDQLSADPPASVAARALHTLKGNAAVYGLWSVASACHAAEDALDADPTLTFARAVAPVRGAWEDALARIRKEFPVDRPATVEVPPHDLVRLAQGLQALPGGEPWARQVRAWAATPAGTLARRLVEAAERVAERTGKAIRVELTGADVRVDGDGTRGLWSALVHVVRNAVDHGIESPEVRVSLGKPAMGTVSIAVHLDREDLSVAISDDGAGVDWQAVAARGRALGLPVEQQEDRQEALFADGLSTRDEVTDLSGRGVGLSAVRGAALALGGMVAVHSVPGQGSRFEVRIPRERAGVEHATA